jgi:thioredoxin reductase (NADPH)
MPQSVPPLIEARHDQMFPVLEPADIERLARFGERKTYASGEQIVTTGEIAPGAFIIVEGQIDVSQRELGHSELIVTHGPGSFMGELAQLSGRPSLIDASAIGVAETLLIPLRRLRDLLVEEAELGERIMRALILRRVGLLETGAGGPVIVGGAAHADVLRLEGFLAHNGHPYQRLDPETDPCAQTLIERFHLKPSELPIVLCPSGELLRNPSEDRLARSLGLVGPIDPNKIYSMTWSSLAPARRASPPRFTQPPRVFRCWCWIVARSAVKLARRRGSRIIWVSRPGSPVSP